MGEPLTEHERALAERPDLLEQLEANRKDPTRLVKRERQRG